MSAQPDTPLLEAEHLHVHFPVRGGGLLGRTREYVHAVSDVSFTENLFLRDNQPSGDGRRYADLTQFWNIHDLRIERNTIWDDKGIVLAAEAAQVSPSASVTSAGNGGCCRSMPTPLRTPSNARW